MIRSNDPQAMQTYSLSLRSDRKAQPAVGSAKVNGKVRTWKRSPERIEVPLKYGLREYVVFTFNECRARLLRAIPTNGKVYT